MNTHFFRTHLLRTWRSDTATSPVVRIGLLAVLTLGSATGSAQPSIEALKENSAAVSAFDRMQQLLKNRMFEETDAIYYARLSEHKELLSLALASSGDADLPQGLPNNLQVSVLSRGRATLKWTDSSGAHSRRIRVGQSVLSWNVVRIKTNEGVTLRNSLGETHTITR